MNALTLLLAWSLVGQSSAAVAPPSGNSVEIDAQFLNRGDLPDDIDFPLLTLDLAVLRVRFENGSQQDWIVSPDALQVRDPKGKTLKPAALEEITPKVMKSGRTSKRFAGGGAEIGTRQTYPGRLPGTGYPGTVGVPMPGNGGAGTVAVGEAQRIRAILESHQLKDSTLKPGEVLEALIYLKSKKPASKLAGGTLRLPNGESVEIR